MQYINSNEAVQRVKHQQSLQVFQVMPLSGMDLSGKWSLIELWVKPVTGGFMWWII